MKRKNKIISLWLSFLHAFFGEKKNTKPSNNLNLKNRVKLLKFYYEIINYMKQKHTSKRDKQFMKYINICKDKIDSPHKNKQFLNII